LTHLDVRLHDLAPREARRAPGAPLGDERQHLVLPLLGQRREIVVEAGLEEPAHAVEHVRGEEGRDRSSSATGVTDQENEGWRSSRWIAPAIPA